MNSPSSSGATAGDVLEVDSIEKSAGHLSIPNSIYVYMQQPRYFWLSTSSDGLLLELEIEVRTLRRIAISVLRRMRGWRKIRRASSNSSRAEFTDARTLIPDGCYAIGNYFPLFHLFSVSSAALSSPDSGRAAINAQTWASITDYHEHLALEDQDSTAHDASKLLCSVLEKQNERPARILELGCGAGRNLYWLSKSFPEAEIIGVDINGSADIQAFLPDNVRFIQADVLALDFAKLGHFDAVITCGFLMHINHADVKDLLVKIRDISTLSIHLELHGPANRWDFHRYPRDYRAVFESLDLAVDDYTIYAGDPVYSYSLSKSFAHALLIRS